MSAQQQSLITTTEDAVTIARLRKNIHRLLQETGNQASCRRNPKTGGAGCAMEIFFVPIKGGEVRAVDDEGNSHVCGEAKL